MSLSAQIVPGGAMNAPPRTTIKPARDVVLDDYIIPRPGARPRQVKVIRTRPHDLDLGWNAPTGTREFLEHLPSDAPVTIAHMPARPTRYEAVVAALAAVLAVELAADLVADLARTVA